MYSKSSLDINPLLRESSRKVFSGLDETYSRILIIIGTHGTLNQREIGDKTNDYAQGFDRWLVKNRLEGSKQHFGLIKYEFVYRAEINRKERRYGLTTKGLLALLAWKKFENISIVKRYRQFLYRIIPDKKIITWSIDFIKHEIALILCYNYLRGLDLTRFKSLQLYWDSFKKYDNNVIDNFFLNKTLMGTDESSVYEQIKNQYMKLYSILDLTTFPLYWKHNTNYYYHKASDPKELFRRYVDGWYRHISMYEIEERPADFDLKRDDLRGLYDIDLHERRDWKIDVNDAWSFVSYDLEKEGYEVPDSYPEEYTH